MTDDKMTIGRVYPAPADINKTMSEDLYERARRDTLKEVAKMAWDSYNQAYDDHWRLKDLAQELERMAGE